MARRNKNDVRQMSTKHLREELARSDAIFWAWQAGGLRPSFNVEEYGEELSEELLARGHVEEVQ